MKLDRRSFLSSLCAAALASLLPRRATIHPPINISYNISCIVPLDGTIITLLEKRREQAYWNMVYELDRMLLESSRLPI